MKNILVPTDFSEHSQIALNFAVQIAKRENGKVTLVHVLNLPQLSDSWIDFGYDESWEDVLKKAQTKADDGLKQMTKDHLGKDYLVNKVLQGSALDTLLDHQKEVEYDLLVVGTKRMSEIGAYLFGTFTDRLVHKSSIPVLVVKQETDFSDIKKVLIGNSFKLEGHELESNIKTIKALVDAELEILRVNTPTDFISQDVFDERIQDIKNILQLKSTTFSSINFKNTGDGIIYQASKTHADMIVIGDKHSSTFRRWVIGEDLAEHVMDSSNLPVLIL